MEEDLAVLEAEEVLSKVLKRLEAPGRGSRAAVAAEKLRKEPVFAEVVRHAGLYDSASTALAPSDFTLCWKRDDAEMYIRSPPGATWFEYRLVARIDAPLRHCLVPLHERDLIIKYQPVFTEPHREIGPQGKHYAVVRTLSKVLAFYIETVFELLRVNNYGYGFIIERAMSEFNDTIRDLPERPWWARRVSLDTKNLWLPEGGNRSGTYLIAISRVKVGIPLREQWLTYLLHTLSPSILKNIRGGAHLAMEAGSPWNERLRKDADGFYRELEEVEQAAARREAVTMDTLPGDEIFDRKWSLGAHDAGQTKKRSTRRFPLRRLR